MCGLDNYQGDDMQSMCPSKKGQQNDFFIILQKSQFGDLPKLTTKCLKFISNHSMVVSGTYYNPFQGLFTHSGAWGGLRSQNFDFLTKKKFLRKCSYLRNQTSHRVGSGVKTTVGPRATRMTIQIKCTSSSFHDRLSFIKHL